MQAEINRMLWRCRRGLLELDLILPEFIKRHFKSLSDAQLEAFDELLNHTDNDLWDMIIRKKSNGIEEQEQVLTLLRKNHAES